MTGVVLYDSHMHATPDTTPVKPYEGFPLFPHRNGQWAKKVKGSLHYFGSWRDDPKGAAALRDWLGRQDAIQAGLDRLRVSSGVGGHVLRDLLAAYLTDCRTRTTAGELSLETFKDRMKELPAFAKAVGMDAQVAALKPEHFSQYNTILVTERKLGRHARKRVIAYIKSMLNWGAGQGWYPTPAYGNGFTAPDTSPDAMRQAKARAGVQDFSKLIITGAQVDTLVAHANRQYAAIILLGVNCGLGPADLGRLRWRHVNMETGALDMPRGKTGTERHGYLWKRTRKAMLACRTLKHNKADLEKNGPEALVFRTRKNHPMYRATEVIEDGESAGIRIDQTISGAIGKLVKSLGGMPGVTFYRLRHTFKTLGKKARDKDALNLMMGHRERTTGETYDHEDIEPARVKRVALKVKAALWPSVARKCPPATS